VVFALVVGAAFAADISGDVIGHISPLQGSSEKDSDVNAYGMFGRIRLEGQGQNDDGTFGGWVRFEAPNDWGNGGETWGKGVSAYGLVWWKPVDMFKFQIGANPDGHFGADGVARWGFYQVASDVRVASEGWKFSESFYGGYGAASAILTLTPIEALAINIGIPFLQGNWGTKAENVFKKTNAQIAYDISGVGKLALTYAGDLNNWVKADGSEANGSKLYVYFGLSAIENLGVDIGLGYTLAVEDENSKATYNAPLAVGLAVNFGAGDFGIKVRVQGQFGETFTPKGGKEAKGPTVVIADLLPSFAINDKLSALLSAGLDITAPDEGDAVVGWHIEPYITLKANWWAPNFYAGIRIESDGTGDKITEWSVPIGIVFSF